MYKAMGDESAFRDGVFSHAAPRQAYQGGGRQFADGSLGAFSQSASTRGRHGVRSAPRLRPTSMTGIGSNEYRDGSLGYLNTSSFRDGSLGQAWRDGSLGDDATNSGTTIQIGPDGASITPTQTTDFVPIYKQPAFLVGAGIVAVAVTYFVMKR